MVKEINIKIKLYAYNELKEDAQNKAFDEHLNFLSGLPYEYETEDENGKTIEKIDNILNWENDQIKEYVEDSININEYMFFENGEIANITHYTGQHEKTGKTEFKFLNKVYEV